MITINSANEALKFAQTFGKNAVNFVLANQTLSMLSCEYLTKLIKLSEKRSFDLESFNDGNNNYDVVVEFHLDVFNNIPMENILIVRTGIGHFRASLSEAMASRSITIDQCHKIITTRNNIQLAIDALSD